MQNAGPVPLHPVVTHSQGGSMRFVTKEGAAAVRRGLLALAALALGASTASAQMVFDGNLLFINNGTGTLAGQFSGAAGAGAPSCAGGLTAAQLGTVIYTHNVYADPLL